MAATLAQLNAYVGDEATVAADAAKLQTDTQTETADAVTVAGGLSAGGQAILSADGTQVYVFIPSTSDPRGFAINTYPLTTG
jgi:hypothetical protein